jgi:Protein of unknown function (DUF669)
MPRIDFSSVEDAKDYTPIPEGEYLCRIDKVEEALTGAGNEMWKLRLAVVSGEHKGRFLFDNLVFSEKALKRAKFVCRCLGVDVSGEIDLTPEMIVGKQANVRVEIEEYVDDEGHEKKRNRVPFAGYDKTEDDDAAEPSGGGREKLPF